MAFVGAIHRAGHVHHRRASAARERWIGPSVRIALDQARGGDGDAALLDAFVTRSGASPQDARLLRAKVGPDYAAVATSLGPASKRKTPSRIIPCRNRRRVAGADESRPSRSSPEPACQLATEQYGRACHDDGTDRGQHAEAHLPL